MELLAMGRVKWGRMSKEKGKNVRKGGECIIVALTLSFYCHHSFSM